MDDSMAQQSPADSLVPEGLAYPAWKRISGWVCAALLAALFLLAGVWKLSDPQATAVRMNQALIPLNLSLITGLLTGVAEVFAGILLLLPRYRRWGAWITGLMLVAFMLYIGINYSRLQGADCSCFPWLKRAVGPGFFISDAAMLLLAAGAAVWSRRPFGLRAPVLILAAIAVFAGVMYGVTESRNTGTPAPPTVTVEGKPYSLQSGRIFVYFFDPECMHCNEAARRMSQYKWKDVKLVGTPTTQPQWGRQFLDQTGLNAAALTLDGKLLKEKFPFGDPPYAVGIENGRQVAAFPGFDENEPAGALRKLGWIE